MAKTRSLIQPWLRWLNIGSRRLDWLQKLWLVAPIAIWFSYQPLINFGADSVMHFELSISLIYLLVLALSGLPTVWRGRLTLVKSRLVWLIGGFVAWNGISLFWSASWLRGGLTFGIIGLLYLVFLAAFIERLKLVKIVPSLVKILLSCAALMSILAIIQLVAGIWLGQGQTLLCDGCLASQFGFARPNVFAIEPQFFGSLLLVPSLILANSILKGKSCRWRSLWFSLLVTALFLTLSRGAILAFAVGLLLLLIFQTANCRRLLVIIGLITVSFSVSLSFQGAAAALNPNIKETFFGAVTKSLNHLSMNLIDFSWLTKSSTEQTTFESAAQSPKPQFSGYVAESTDVRLNLSKLGLATWSNSNQHQWLGVGLGSSGIAMAEQAGHKNAREIVQNEYVELLLELGIIGAATVLALIGIFIILTRRQKLFWAIGGAFLVQSIFFSGYPNALHIYLTVIIIVVYSTTFYQSTILSRGQPKPARSS
jgi:hypothetical protein